MSNNDQGTLFIVSAPSGAGKSSLLHAALMESQGIQLSVSHTTRTPRNGEEDGLHYNFVTTEAFGAEIEADQFLEYAKVFDNFYGTSELWVRESLRHGNDVILEIDWQGAEQVRKKIPEAVTLFILPPSLPTLRQRLEQRGQDSEEVIARRLEEASIEISHYNEYDYLVINDEFDAAKRDLKSIFQAHRLKTSTQSKRNHVLLEGLL